MEKNHLIVHVDNKYTCAKSIFMDCNKAIPNRLLRFALLLTKHARQRTLSCQNFNTLSMQTVITIVVIIQNFI